MIKNGIFEGFDLEQKNKFIFMYFNEPLFLDPLSCLNLFTSHIANAVVSHKVYTEYVYRVRQRRLINSSVIGTKDVFTVEQLFYSIF